MKFIYIIILLAFVGFLVFRKKFRNKFGWIEPGNPFSIEWKIILIKNVTNFNSLSNEEKS